MSSLIEPHRIFVIPNEVRDLGLAAAAIPPLSPVSPSQNRKQGHLNIKKNKPVEILRGLPDFGLAFGSALKRRGFSRAGAPGLSVEQRFSAA
jgi:hypothetical protein